MKHAKQALDPICGMTVDIDPQAIQTSFGGHTYYFCASECLKAFMARPEHYLKALPKS